MSRELPYDFDLHFDIKTEEQLVQEYRYAATKMMDIERLCESHGISLKDLIKQHWSN